jgi:arylsulfatase A-like enzyme
MPRAVGRLALLVCAGLGPACSDEAANPSPAGELDRPQAPPAAGRLSSPPTIVLITLDTLRREHLGCYGYFRPTSPHIDALAADALFFERALASMASTLPSHLTLLTGLYPHQHGMTSNRRAATVSFTSELGRLSAADVLRRCGYRTAAFVSAVPLAPTTGIQAGFETYSCPESGKSLRAGERNEEVLAWLDRHAAEPGPFFLWVHYFDPHEPNDPVPPYDAMFTTDEAQLEWIRARRIDPAALTDRYGSSSRIQGQFLPGRRADARPGKDRPAAISLERIADLMNRYDGEARYMDDRLGELLEALKSHGRYDDSILVVVGDHGQSLGEDVRLGHGTISNVNTFVPLIVRLPAAIAPRPQRVGALVSLADVLPTLMARFELPGRELLLGQFEGEDVLAGDFGRDFALVERSADEVRDTKTGHELALVTRRWKLLLRADGEDQLYDLAGAGESENVIPRHPDVAAGLRAQVDAILARKPALLDDERARPEDAELLKGLEDLGYVGGDE